jgi:hypothetical protein
VEDIAQVTQPQAIVKQPRNAREHFNNAWVHLNIRRDMNAAWRSLQGLYAGEPGLANGLYAAARNLDPELPIAVWDMQRAR